MHELAFLMDKFSPILKDEFLNAIDRTQNAIKELIFKNYPQDIDTIPIESGISETLLNELEAQLSQGFEENLTALYDNSELPIILLLSVYKLDTNKLKNDLINSEIKILLAESKAVYQITGIQKKRIIESIGLTLNQAKSLSIFRNELEQIAQGKTKSISTHIIRNLSASQRSAIRSAINKGIEPADVDTLVKKQHKALLINRAKAIGNHLSSKVAHAAQQGIIDLAIYSGLIQQQAYKRFWHTAKDERVRQSHNQTEAMNAKGVGLKQPFNTPLGPRMNPPLEINCRCHVSIRKI